MLPSHFLSTNLLPFQPSFNSVEGLLLLGGQSVRFGKDKRFQDIEGRAMYLRTLDVLQTVCSHVNLSVAPDSPDSPGTDADLGILSGEGDMALAAIHDVRRVGPLGGIEAVLSQRKSHQLVVAADLPAVSSESLARLLTTARRAEAQVVVARAAHARRVQPLCGVWKASVLPELVQYLDTGKRSVMGLVDTLSAEIIDFPDRELVNINRPEDLDLLTEM